MDRLLLWINIALAVGAAAFAGRAVHTVMRPLPMVNLSVPAAMVTSKADNRGRIKPLSTYGFIAQRDLFHIEALEGKPVVPAMDLDNLAPTRLKLKLWGTIAGEGYRPYAVIEDPKQREQRLFRIGDSIQGAQVKMIMREKVVLTVNGRDEVLTMEENGISSVSARDQRRPETSPGSMPERINVPQMSQTPPSRQVTVDLESINDSMAKIDELQKQIRARVQMENGQPAGVMLSGIRPDSIFRKMGLRSGDVVSGVDGGTLNVETPEDLGNLVEQLASDQSISLQVKRGGRSTLLEIQAE